MTETSDNIRSRYSDLSSHQRFTTFCKEFLCSVEAISDTAKSMSSLATAYKQDISGPYETWTRAIDRIRSLLSSYKLWLEADGETLDRCPEDLLADILSRICHDLISPVSGVRGTSILLHDVAVGRISDKYCEQIKSAIEISEQAANLVQVLACKLPKNTARSP